MQVVQSSRKRDTLNMRGSTWANGALVLVSVIVSLLLIETAYRLAVGIPPLQFANWRTEHIVMFRMGKRVIIDPVLGWTLKPRYEIDNYTTLEYGLRQNFEETTVRTDAVLAVGDSFTEGWDVADDQSWPSHLEKLTSVPIVNAGVAGYGTDQIVLRAEQMLSIVKPKILIVDFLEADISRAGHSAFGSPKPYFTLENGELRYHPPAPIEPPGSDSFLASLSYKFRDILGYSAAADYVLARLNPDYYYGRGTQASYRRADTDETEVTCALLRRLKARTDREGIRMILFMQYNASLLLSSDKSTDNSRYVVSCAKATGIRVVDQFESLRAIVAANPIAIRDYYVAYGQSYGHMTAKGNEHAAYLLAAALRDWLPLATGSSQPAATSVAPAAAVK
jgi:hypothetical protein